MIPNAVAGFLGAFAALMALELVPRKPNATLGYFGAFLAGVVLTVALAFLLGWVSSVFSRVG